MRHLSADIETYSDVDIKTCGLYKYAQRPAFDVLLIAYSVDGGPVSLLDLTKSETPGLDEFTRLLLAPDTILHAYNAAFEWYCLSQYLPRRRGVPVDAGALLARTRCTMAHALYCGCAAGLAATGEALGLPRDRRKASCGAALIRTFCAPHKPDRAHPAAYRVRPQDEPEKWRLFCEYCRQDVTAEMEIERRLARFPMPEREQTLWELDCRMNAAGVATDEALVRGALACGARAQDALLAEAVSLTGLGNPKSVPQLTAWLEDELGSELPDLTKDTVSRLLEQGAPDEKTARVLAIRQQLSKTSTKKYDALAAARCADGRVRGLMQYYGANRTGRWAGRLIQPQNLPRNYLEPLGYARELTKAGRDDLLALVFGSVPDTLSQLVRTAFVPSAGRRLLVADFSAIEARVIAWLAGEAWVLDVFRTHGKIYEATAAQMFGVPLEKIAKGNPEYALRQKGKVATLALGYQGGAGALIAMGALKQGLTEEELPDIVRKWREANPSICDLWRALEQAAIDCVRTGRPQQARHIGFAREESGGLTYLTMRLPSGRKLFYARPFLCEGTFGREALHFLGVNAARKWAAIPTFGGKLAENAVQAIARDCLAETLLALDAAGMETVFHVHDEVIVDWPGDPEEGLAKALDIMARPIPWAPGLPLKGAGFHADFYQKD